MVLGGGLAGLTCATLLAAAGHDVLLAEKKQYPFHRVCGEYVSNEAKPFLTDLGVFKSLPDLPQINSLLVSSPSGRTLETPLDLGGFGVSRYALDHSLCQLAKAEGAKVWENAQVDALQFNNGQFEARLQDGRQLRARLVIGAFGKRSVLDANLNRGFLQKRSPYIGVKYHIESTFPDDLIALHNFENGYCGISKIEDGKHTLCYLSHHSSLKKEGSIARLEKNVLQANPHLKEIFGTARFLYDKPLVISEVSFSTKSCFEQQAFMVGDAAGMIAPLCGNGMAMALHGAKTLAGCIIEHGLPKNMEARAKLGAAYATQWNSHFANRLKIGRAVQGLFGKKLLTNMAISTLGASPALLGRLVKLTHGKVF